MCKLKIGFTIGKFAPLHKGHQLLIETALREMDKFYVIVYDTDLINIKVDNRAKWVKDLYPNVEILIANKPPKKYGLDKESVEIQMQYLTKILGDIKVTHFYSSEPYGKCVADYLNIVDRRIDNDRKIVPISASKIRKDLSNNKQWVENIVYNDLKKFE